MHDWEYNRFYANRPSSSEEKQEILKFLELEAECDRENEEMFNMMDLSHLSKTKRQQALTATNVWNKNNKRLVKHYKSVEPFSLNRRRTWYES